MRNRVYDSSSRAFLSPDPLPAVPGTAWSGNPYHYAGNDPVGHADPLGLRPISDSELAAYRDGMGSGFFEDAADWVGENWEYLAAGAMVVGGVALMFTGVGGPAGIALMAASGGLIAGGASAGIQKFTTGEVNWGQVGRDALIGAAAGGVGAGTVAALSSSTRLAATNPFVRELVVNGAESVVSGGIDRGLTGGDIFNPRALTADLLGGGVLHSPAALRSPAPGELVDVWRFHNAADPQTLRSRLSAEPPHTQRLYEWALENDPTLFPQMREEHATGFYTHSPFVSVTDNPAAAAATTDPGLSTIINGFPGPSYMQAPDMSYFRVPSDRLHRPDFELSHQEGELVFYGDDLADFLVETRPNPYLLPPSGGP
ncbi:RHS repeat-associated core domain-containing protein [Actinoplanes missouriensis]|uniref:RHS repeat-associated core domain-containing protein n=1 Tax=Actinoplanes missouriensis TaxID=1866 RepID=UPI0033D814DC